MSDALSHGRGWCHNPDRSICFQYFLMPDHSPKTITVGLLVGWFLGVAFLLSGVGTVLSEPLAAFFMILAGLASLPPAAAFAERSMRFKLSRGVRVLVVIVCLFVAGVVNGPASGGPASDDVGRSAGEPRLELQNFRVYEEYGYSHIDGMVTNISGEPMKNVQAVGEFYTEDGTFVKSAEALLEYNPILPGQSSPFQVLTTTNPAIKKGHVVFKELFGGTIPTRFPTEEP